VNEQLRREGQQLPWLILAAILLLVLLMGLLLWQSWEPQTIEVGPLPESSLQSLPAPSTSSTLLSLASAGSLSIGQPAPDFSLKTLDGQTTVKLSELRGKPVILNFWASWCAPCRQEMPALQAAYEAHQADGLTVLAINLTTEDTLPNAQTFVEELQLTIPALADEANTAGEAYHILGLPTTYFVDPQGIITYLQLGPLDEAQLNSHIENIVAAGN
jgi:cytochrome c biogenesis protein CcmG, thiol:disulfide interchange protein DsbE